MINQECRTCKNTADFAGNYVECVMLHKFVDWWYWRGICPDDCPLREEKQEGEG